MAAWFDTRWRKGLRDLGWARSASLALALALGQAAGGVLLLTWAGVERATEQGFRASLPVSATLRLGADQRFETEPLKALMAQQPEWAAWRLRRQATAQVRTGSGWRNAWLTAVDDATRSDIGHLQPDGGPWPAPAGALLMERSSLGFSEAQVGEPLLLRVEGQDHRLPLVGLLRDVSLAPGWMENLVYLQTHPDTLTQLGLPAGFNELQLRLRDANAPRATVRQRVAHLQALLQAQGLSVQGVDIPEPGQHVHAAQMNSLLLTQGAFALLSLAAAGFLAFNLFAARLEAQRRELGILKALGASARTLWALGLGPALLLGLGANALALPVVLWGAQAYTAFKLELLNFPASAASLSGGALLLWAVIGLLVPLLSAAVPLRQALREPVARQLDPGRDLAWGGGKLPYGSERLGPWVGLALAALLRRRLRTLLTAAALGLALASLFAAASLGAAVLASVDQLFAAQNYQLMARLERGGPVEALEQAAAGVAGVASAEAWRSQRATASGDERPFPVIGVPSSTPHWRAALAEGRWLQAPNELIVGRSLLRRHADWRLGETMILQWQGQTHALRLVGVIESGTQALALIHRDALAGPATRLALRLHPPDDAAATAEAGRAIQEALAQAGHPVANVSATAHSRRVLEDHLLMVVNFLAVMGVLLMAVAALGLAATLAQSVRERRREIGVLRALGLGDVRLAGLLALEAGGGVGRGPAHRPAAGRAPERRTGVGFRTHLLCPALGVVAQRSAASAGAGPATGGGSTGPGPAPSARLAHPHRRGHGRVAPHRQAPALMAGWGHAQPPRSVAAPRHDLSRQ